jgi:hypothetical protein
MKARQLTLAALMAAAALIPNWRPVVAAEEKAPENPLARMEPLVGGKWYLDAEKLKAYNTYEWGPTHRVIHFASYFLTESGPRLRAEGSYLWDPARKKIVVRTVGTDGDLYDGDTLVDGKKLTNEFTHATADRTDRFRETFDFTEKDTYRWTLYSTAGAEPKQLIQADFHRR